jgi:hypothetical protein
MTPGPGPSTPGPGCIKRSAGGKLCSIGATQPTAVKTTAKHESHIESRVFIAFPLLGEANGP